MINMKTLLIKTFLGYFFLVFLHAEDFSYNIKTNKSTPYVKEAFILTLELNQSNKAVVLLFNFSLKKSADYDFQRIDIEEDETYHNLHIKYTYLVYALKSGKVAIDFELVKKVTTDASIAYSFSGDRDNVKTLETKDSKIHIKPLTLKVKALPKGTQVVGDFKLSYDIEKHQAKAHEPLPFSVTIQGRGFPPVLPLLVKEGNFTTFEESPILQSVPKDFDKENLVKYTMAFSHESDFSLSPINIKAFNPATQKSYTLFVPKQDFSITKLPFQTLLDKSDNPPSIILDLSYLEYLWKYLIVFMAGFATAYSLKFSKSVHLNKEENPLIKKIKAVNSTKTLLQLLISLNNPSFKPLIAKIEKILLSKDKAYFKGFQKEALNLVF